MAGSWNSAGAAGSLNNAAGTCVGGRKPAPGSGLNCGAGSGGGFVLRESRQVQLVTGAGAAGNRRRFGSGLNTVGGRGGVLVLRAWCGFRPGPAVEPGALVSSAGDNARPMARPVNTSRGKKACTFGPAIRIFPIRICLWS